MMMKQTALLILCLCSFLGSCVSGGASTIRYSSVFQAQFRVSVVNNTNVLVDLEINGDNVVRNLAPGGTYHWPVYSFRRGDQISVVAKGHKEDGTFVGVASKEFRLYTYNSARQSEVWEIKRFSEPKVY